MLESEIRKVMSEALMAMKDVHRINEIVDNYLESRNLKR